MEVHHPSHIHRMNVLSNYRYHTHQPIVRQYHRLSNGMRWIYLLPDSVKTNKIHGQLGVVSHTIYSNKQKHPVPFERLRKKMLSPTFGVEFKRCVCKKVWKEVALLPKVNFRVFFKGGALEGHHHEPPFSQDFPSLPPFQGNGRWITEVNWCWRRNQRAESKKVISPCHLPCHLLSQTMEKY